MNPSAGGGTWPDPAAHPRTAALVCGADDAMAPAVVAALERAGFTVTTRARARPDDPTFEVRDGFRAIVYLLTSTSSPRSGEVALTHGSVSGETGVANADGDAGDVAAWAAWLAGRGGGQLVVVAPARGLTGGGDPGDRATASLAGAVRLATSTWGSAGVAANLVAAGTPLATGTGADAGERTSRRAVAPQRGSALRGRPVHVDEVASVVAFLCGESAAFVNGAVIPVDGGGSMGFF